MGNMKYGERGFGSTRLNEVNYLIVIHCLDRKGLYKVLDCFFSTVNGFTTFLLFQEPYSKYVWHH